MVVNFAFDGVQLATRREYLGFDRGQAESVMRMMGVKRKRQPEVLEALLTMEFEALPILNGS